MATNPAFAVTPLNVTANTSFGCKLENADGTTAKTAVEGAAAHSLIQDLSVTSDDTVDHEVLVSVLDDAGSPVSHPLCKVSVPAGSGTDISKPAVSLLDPTILPALNKRDDGCYFLGSGHKLQVAVATAVSSGKALNITPLGGNL